MSWTGLFCAACGGFAGAALRYLAYAGAVWWGAPSAWVTLGINWAGSFGMGLLLSAWTPQHPLRVFAVVGILGGFTTFSTFSADTLRFLQEGRPAAALLYAGGSVAGGLAAVWAGFCLRLGQ